MDSQELIVTGIDLDTDPKYIKEGLGRSMTNCRYGLSLNGSSGAIENIKSSSDITPTWSPGTYARNRLVYYSVTDKYYFVQVASTTNIPTHADWFDLGDKDNIFVLNKLEDRYQSRIFYFIGNNTNSKSFVCYQDVKTGYFYRIINDNSTTLLDLVATSFTNGYPTDITYIDSSIINNEIVYTANIIDYGFGIPPVHHLMLKDVLGNEIIYPTTPYLYLTTLNKIPPIYAPYVSYTSSGAAPAFLKAGYQFSARYIYKNGMVSPFGMATQVCYPSGENTATLYFDLGGTTVMGYMSTVIDYVEVAVRTNYLYDWMVLSKTKYPSASSGSTINVIDQFTGASVAKVFDLDVSVNMFNMSYQIARQDMTLGYDDIPIGAKTVEIADNRVFLGNGITGYDHILNSLGTDLLENSATALTAAAIASTTTPNYMCFANNSSYKFGVQFFDQYLRKQFVYTNPKWIFKTGANGTDNLTYYYVDLTIDFTAIAIPSWVAYFNIVVSENLTYQSIVQGAAQQILYVNGRDANNNPRFANRDTTNGVVLTGILTDSTLFPATAYPPTAGYVVTEEAKNELALSFLEQDLWNYGLAGHLNTAVERDKGTEMWIDISSFTRNGANIPYTFTQGDRLRFITISYTGALSNNEQETFPIKEQRGRWIIIDNPRLLSGGGATNVFNYSALIEIFTPKPENNNPLFYESCLTTGFRSTTTTSATDFYKQRMYPIQGSSFTTRIGRYDEGDVFELSKTFYGCSNSLTASINAITYVIRAMNGDATNPTGTYVSLTEANTNQYISGWVKGNNRPNVAPNSKMVQQFNFSTVWVGQQYLFDSNINNLNRFYAGSFKALPFEYGPLNKLALVSNTQNDGNVMLAIHAYETISLYLGKVSYQDVQGVLFTSQANSIIGSERKLRGGYGTINPESVTVWNDKVYWFDAIKGKAIRYAQDGLTPISDTGVGNVAKYFSSLGTAYYNDINQAQIAQQFLFNAFYVAVNPYYEEVYFIHPNKENYLDNGYYVIAWSEKNNKFFGFLDYENGCMPFLNNEYYSFKNGRFYKMEAGSDYGKFFGASTTATSSITAVFNKSSFITKAPIYLKQISDYVMNAAISGVDFGQSTVINDVGVLTGGVSVSTGSATVTGSGTLFTIEAYNGMSLYTDTWQFIGTINIVPISNTSVTMSAPSAVTYNGQVFAVGDWVKKDDHFYAAMNRDYATRINGEGDYQSGDVLCDNVFLIKLSNNFSIFTRLYLLQVFYNISFKPQ